jgi:hypothetical protein
MPLLLIAIHDELQKTLKLTRAENKNHRVIHRSSWIPMHHSVATQTCAIPDKFHRRFGLLEPGYHGHPVCIAQAIAIGNVSIVELEAQSLQRLGSISSQAESC